MIVLHLFFWEQNQGFIMHSNVTFLPAFNAVKIKVLQNVYLNGLCVYILNALLWNLP